MNTSPTFLTIGAAVFYLNGIHHGKHLDRLSYLSWHKPDWVMSIATNTWKALEDGDEPRTGFYVDLLDWAIPDVYTRTLSGEA